MCPRHGDVGTVMRLYRETGKLTNEHAHVRRFPEAAR
jgi:hypothetical protein